MHACMHACRYVRTYVSTYTPVYDMPRHMYACIHMYTTIHIHTNVGIYICRFYMIGLGPRALLQCTALENRAMSSVTPPMGYTAVSTRQTSGRLGFFDSHYRTSLRRC